LLAKILWKLPPAVFDQKHQNQLTPLHKDYCLAIANIKKRAKKRAS